MAIYITGDTHGTYDVNKILKLKGKLTEEDYLIVLGDFAVCWDNNGNDSHVKRFWGRYPCTVLFIDGNHENFTLLNKYPVTEWHNGKVHRISERIIHLLRGQIFEIGGNTFFTMGGAASHDCGWKLDKYIIENIKTYHTHDWKTIYEHPHAFDGGGRVPGQSWWAEEIPSPAEIEEAKANLKKANNTIDHILTHCPPSDIFRQFANNLNENPWNAVLLEFFDWMEENVEYEHWWFGHMHADLDIAGMYTALYNSIRTVG